MLFDLDGTIIDTMTGYAEIACRLIEEHAGIPCERARQLYLQTSGRHFRSQLEAMGIRGDLRELIARRFEEEKKPLLSRSSPAGLVWERVARLKRAGLRVALSTNNECRLVKEIRWMNELFDIVLCHDPDRGLEQGLPHLKILESMGYRPCEIIFIGDSDYDLQVYKPYGIRAVRTLGLWKPEDRAVEEVLSMLGDRGCGGEQQS